MELSRFDFELPPELIAQRPLEDRAASRMLAVHRAAGRWEDRAFRDLPQYLTPGDCLVINDSRVIPARLFGRREGFRGRCEVLLAQPESADGLTWLALVRPGRKIRTGERIVFGEGFAARVLGRNEYGERLLRFDLPAAVPPPEGQPPGTPGPARTAGAETGEPSADSPLAGFWRRLDELGHAPLPPYIRRPDEVSDRERYQTVFARERGSVAAPTAGLHFTPQVLEACERAGARIARVTLHVGLGTFQPLHAARIEDVRLHAERFHVSEEAESTLRAARRVIPVGTTALRAIESWALGRTGSTDLFIATGFPFRVTGALLTNFHLPQSSLFVLVCAFGGEELMKAAYAHAIRARYRFYSYGDCMLIVD